MSYPFPYYRTQRSPYPQCPLPNRIDSVDNYLLAQNVAANCAHEAEWKARVTNDPKWTQYAQWFRCFADDDKARVVYDPDGNGHMQYWGGAKWLLNSGAHTPQWPMLRQALREQVTRFHTGLPAMQQDPTQPTIEAWQDHKTKAIYAKYTR